MLAAERHAYMLEELTHRGAIRIAAVAAYLGVSEMTVRRDLDLLADQGLLIKVHGGATVRADNGALSEPPFKTKSQREQVVKDAIAREAIKMVLPGAALALMGGSTVYALAKQLVSIPRLTIVTNSLPVSDLFQREGRPDQTVILAGGLRTPTDSFVGEITVAVFNRLNIDIAFMGTHGIDARAGLTSPNILEAETNRAVRAHAKKLVILADHTKWGEVAFSTFASLSDTDSIITDEGTDPQVLDTVGQLIDDLQVVQIPAEYSRAGDA